MLLRCSIGERAEASLRLLVVRGDLRDEGREVAQADAVLADIRYYTREIALVLK